MGIIKTIIEVINTIIERILTSLRFVYIRYIVKVKRISLLVISLLFLFPLNSWAEKILNLPPPEEIIINQVAHEYDLSEEGRFLLGVIRIIENGKTPREFGVLNPQALRYQNNPEKSFITQCRWCAGTIKKRFTGDLLSFANRYCPPSLHPLNRNWYRNAKYYFDKKNKWDKKIRAEVSEVHPISSGVLRDNTFRPKNGR